MNDRDEMLAKITERNKLAATTDDWLVVMPARDRDTLLRVVRAAKAMLRHENSPDWKRGLIPWREIAEGVDVDDLGTLAEALKEVEHLI